MPRDPFGDRPTNVSDTFALPPDCPIPWRPNALAPVFYGYRDFSPDPIVSPRTVASPGLPRGGIAEAPEPGEVTSLASELSRLVDVDGISPTAPPARMRVLFPTLDGSPQYAEILAPCGLYPLIVFSHGSCQQGQSGVYLEWARGRLATQLAQAGYVVVVPQLSGQSPTGDSDLGILRAAISWMRSTWEHRDLLAPSTGVMGHSFGGVLAGIIASEGGIDAYAELSAAWHDAPLDILPSIAVPQLHVRGGAEFGDELSGLYERAQLPKHRVVIDNADHYDYLPGTPCQPHGDACACTPAIAADVATMFFGRYLPPPAVPNLPVDIPELLRPPVLQLSLEQEFYAGGYLGGFSCIGDNLDACSISLSYEDGYGSRTETIPWSNNVRDHRTS